MRARWQEGKARKFEPRDQVQSATTEDEEPQKQKMRARRLCFALKRAIRAETGRQTSFFLDLRSGRRRTCRTLGECGKGEKIVKYSGQSRIALQSVGVRCAAKAVVERATFRSTGQKTTGRQEDARILKMQFGNVMRAAFGPESASRIFTGTSTRVSYSLPYIHVSPC